MQNKYLIKTSRKFWLWFWTQLMNGFAPSDLHGNYKRPKGITIDSKYNINNENGQIYLLVGNSCPWCQRTLLVHAIKHLSKKVKVIFLKADLEHGEWIFNRKFKGCMRLSDLYKKANKKIILKGETSYYKILGVNENASNHELRKAFCKLSIELHPDTTSLEIEDAKSKFQEVLEAYENLNNSNLRKIYDDKLKENSRSINNTNVLNNLVIDSYNQSLLGNR